ncbi:MAG: hypothetical protein KDC34_12500 [Saprospiraceae bacterium]|nr:hypothetical protein [Saprospiraceae bacterium]
MKTRIAPTPSGFLHLGNLLSFAQTWIMVRQLGGRILLRIDDLDASRKRPEYVNDIFESLEVLGIDWDEGPSGPDDFEQNWSQRHRKELYQSVLTKIEKEQPAFIYACTCSRKELALRPDSSGCSCRNEKKPLNVSSQPSNWKIRTGPDEMIRIPEISGGSSHVFPGEDPGDFVIRKKDGVAAYQLSSVLDDLHFGIDSIVRGKDLLPSTGAQIFLSEKLEPLHPNFHKFKSVRFWHHDLVLDKKGEKLSKSAGAESTGGWIKQAGARMQFFALLAKTRGWQGTPPNTLEPFLSPDY